MIVLSLKFKEPLLPKLKGFVDEDAAAIVEAVTKLRKLSEEKAKGDKNLENLYLIQVLKGSEKEGIPGDVFSPQFIPTSKNSPSSTVLPVNSVPVMERRTDYLDAKATFLTETALDDPLGAYNVAISNFKTNIVERCIYNVANKRLFRAEDVLDDTGLSYLNTEILKYKIDLINRLNKQLHPKITYSLDDFRTNADLTNTVTRLLQEYRTKVAAEKKVTSLDAFEAFAILQNFDLLLKSEFSKTISVKSEYADSNTMGLDMYSFLGGNVQFDDSFSDESADAASYSSAIVKQLLSYFKRKRNTSNGLVDSEKSIGFVSFTSLMSRVKEWIENGTDVRFKELLYLDKGSRSSGNNVTWADAINAYLKENQKYLTTDELEAMWGIRDNVLTCDGLLQRILENQVAKTIRYRYLQTKSRNINGRWQMATAEMSDSLIDTQNFNVQRMVQAAVYNLQRNAGLRENLFNKYGITISTNGGNTVVTINSLVRNADTENGTKPVTITFFPPEENSNRYRINASTFNGRVNGNIVSIITDFIGFPLSNAVADAFNKIKPDSTYGLYDAFINLIGLTVVASDISTSNLPKEWKDPIHFKDGLFVTYPYTQQFNSAAYIMSELYSTTDTIVIRNSEGNALPNYQILSSIYSLKQQMFLEDKPNNMRNGTHDDNLGRGRGIHSDNIVKKRKLIGNIYTRGEITRGTQSKASNQLTQKEALYLDVVENFYKRLSEGKSIILQPNCFSDKKTHFLVEYLVNQRYINNQSIGSIFQNFIVTGDENKRSEYRNLFRSEIISSNSSRVKQQLLSQFRRYEAVYGANLGTGWVSANKITTVEDYKKNIELLRAFLRNKTGQQIRDDFKSIADLTENFDFYEYKDYQQQRHCDMNYMLLHEAEMFIFDTRDFDTFWKFQVKQFAKSLEKTGFKFDCYWDPSLNLDVSKLNEWNNPASKTVKPFIATKNGKLCSVEEADNIRLHPIIEAYMYANAYLSQPTNDMMFGTTNGFANKYTGENLYDLEHKGLSDSELKAKRFNIYTKFEAAKLLDETKRTVIAGAVRTPYAQGLRYGVSRVWKIAVVDDIKATAFNHTGEVGTVDACDGSGIASPYVSRQINESLLDARVGRNKKTIGHQVDFETGVLQEIKWAEFELTNQQRINSIYAENMFRKMHNQELTWSQKSRLIANISNFYRSDSGQVLYDSEDGRKLTHTAYIYFKDNESGKYYRINSIALEGVGRGTKVVQHCEVCDANGNITGPREDFYLDVNSIYELDKVFGGAYCMKLENGTLVKDSANYDIVANILGFCDLKSCITAYMVNKSAMKVGPTNVNNSNVFDPSNTDELKYFEMQSLYFGVQMNADHELDEAKVSEMTQMMQALMQSAQNTGTVTGIYHLVGEIALENIRKYKDLLEGNAPNDEIYVTIGKLFVDNFTTGSSNSISLADAFIINAARALKYKNADVKIPFSSNQIKSIFEATLTSTFNKLGIRRKYAGFGGVQCPSYHLNQLYYHPIKGTFVDKETMDDYVRAELALNNPGGKWKVGNVYSKISIDGVMNPFIRPIDKNDVTIEDTVIIKRKGSVGTGSEIKIADIRQLDFIRHLLDDNYEVYKWTIASRDLSQSRETVNINGQKSYLSDLDYERAMLYLQKWEYVEDIINFNIELEDQDYIRKRAIAERDRCIATVMKGSGMEYKNGTFTITDPNLVGKFKESEYADIAVEWCAQKLQKTLNTLAALGYAEFSIGGSTVRLDGFKKRSAQMMIGQVNARQFNLRKGDKISDILEQREAFFEERLKSQYVAPTEMERSQFDGIAYERDGRKCYVIFESGDSTYDRLNGFELNNKYQKVNGKWVKDGEEMFDVAGVSVYMDANGNDVFVVKNKNAYNSVKSSKQFVMYRDLFNDYSVKKLLTWNPVYEKHVDKGSVLDAYITEEQRNFDTQIEELAQKQFYAFKAHLNHVITRIPSQSMQSFMDVVVDIWADTEMNETYVARSVTWIQGSDYDVDKGYILAFNISDDGTLETLSDLQDRKFPTRVKDAEGNDHYMYKYLDPYEILSLVAPRGLNFYEDSKASIKLTFKDVLAIHNGDIIRLNKVLKKAEGKRGDRIGISFEDIDQKYKDEILKMLEIHEKSKRQGKRLTAALQNTCVKGILDVLRSPASQIYMSIPIAMDSLKAIAKKSQLSKEEESISLYNPGTIFMMQEQNMTGREVIGIGAVSLKHYFAASTFIHSQIKKIETILKNGRNNNFKLTDEEQDQLIDLLFDLVFDSKLDDGIATLANLHFDTISILLGEYKAHGFDGILRSSKGNIVDLHQKSGNKNIFNEKTIRNGSEVNCIDGKNVDFSALINKLDRKSNGEWWRPVKVISDDSEVLSAATDNAKELILSKINATTKFADVYTYLLSIGTNLEDISKIMMSDTMMFVSRYTQSNIYDTTIQYASLENAIDFILDRRPLDGINQNVYSAFLSNTDLLEFLSTKIEGFKTAFNDLGVKLQNALIDQYSSNDDRITVDSKGREISTFNFDGIVQFFKGKYEVGSPEYNAREACKEDLINIVNTYLKSDPDAFLAFLINRINVTTSKQEFSPEDYIDAGLEFDVSDSMLDSSEAFSEDEYLARPNYGYELNFTLDQKTCMRLYKYLSEYVIPKNQRLAELINRHKEHPNTTEDPEELLNNFADKILPGVAEQRLHGQILGINQGLDTNDYKEFKWIYNIERFINSRYVATNEAPDFDMLQFISDESYRETQIKKYENVKSSVNLLKSITSVEHFWDMIQIAGINRSYIERSAAIRIERDAVKRLFASMSYDPKFKSISEKEFKELGRVISDSLFYNWISSLPLTIPVIDNNKQKTANGLDPAKIFCVKDGKIEQLSIRENVNKGLMAFKRLMEEYLIPKLKLGYIGKDNYFIECLIKDVKKDSITKAVSTFYKPSINLADASKSPKLEGTYALIARSFNELANKSADDYLGKNCGWTFGDLFYLYNLLLTRDSIGGNSFTKLFEEFTTSNDRNSLVYKYNQFLGELDNGELRWTDSTTDKDDKNRINYGLVTIDLRDIRYRCGASNPKGKFGFRKTDDGMYLDELKLEIDKDSQYINLPFLSGTAGGTSTNIEPAVSRVPVVRNRYINPKTQANDRELFMAIVNNLKELTGDRVRVNTYNGDTLDINDPKRSAHGYMEDGEIYLNIDNFSLDTPVHEYMHIVCAILKYGSPAQQNLYYKMLNAVATHTTDDLIFGYSYRWWTTIKEHLIATHTADTLVGSDFQEEILVHGLAKAFEDGFLSKIKETTSSRVEEDVREAMKQVFGLNPDLGNKVETNDMNHISLRDFLGVFNSQFYGDYSVSIAGTVIPTNQKLAKLKKQLVKNGNLIISKDC